MEAEVNSEMASYVTAESHKNGLSAVTFNDPLFLESFCLLYEASLATLCFFAEILITVLQSLAAQVVQLHLFVVYLKRHSL